MHGNAHLRARSRQRARGYRRGSNLRSTAGRTAVHPGTSFPHDAELLAASNLFALSCVSAGYAIPQQDGLGDGRCTCCTSPPSSQMICNSLPLLLLHKTRKG